MAAAFGVGTRRASTCRPTSRPAVRTPTGRPGWRGGRRTRPPTARRPSAATRTCTDPTERAYLTQLASENCTDGWRYRAGDNADMAIGQGETTMSPLQLALAYSALVNGGRIWEPTLGWAVVDGNGKVVRRSTRRCATGCRCSQTPLDYIAQLAELQPRLGGVRRVRLPRLAVPHRHRRQDRHRRGLRQAGHVVARDVGADLPRARPRPGAVRASSA